MAMQLMLLMPASCGWCCKGDGRARSVCRLMAAMTSQVVPYFPAAPQLPMRTPTNPSPPCDAIKLYGMIESSPHTDACHARWNDTWFLHRNFILSACCRAHSVLRCSCDTATRRIPEVSTFGAVISWTSSKALKIDNHVDRTGVWPAEGGRREYGGAGAGGGVCAKHTTPHANLHSICPPSRWLHRRSC